MRLFFLAVWTLWQRELVRFYRQPSRVIGALAPPVLFWLLIGAGLGPSFHAPGAAGGSSYLAYFFPGVVILILLFTAIFSQISIIEDRREGFLQAVLVSPVPRASVVLGKVLGGTTLALLQSVLFLLLGPVIGLRLSPAGALAVLAVLFLLAFALTALACAIAWWLDSTQGFHAIMNLFLIPMWLLAGTLFPVAGTPGWLGAVMRANPLTYGVAALRRTLAPADAADLPGFALSLAVTAACAVLAFAVAGWVATRRPTR